MANKYAKRNLLLVFPLQIFFLTCVEADFLVMNYLFGNKFSLSCSTNLEKLLQYPSYVDMGQAFSKRMSLFNSS